MEEDFLKLYFDVLNKGIIRISDILIINIELLIGIITGIAISFIVISIYLLTRKKFNTIPVELNCHMLDCSQKIKELLYENSCYRGDYCVSSEVKMNKFIKVKCLFGGKNILDKCINTIIICKKTKKVVLCVIIKGCCKEKDLKKTQEILAKANANYEIIEIKECNKKTILLNKISKYLVCNNK